METKFFKKTDTGQYERLSINDILSYLKIKRF